jgi:uncharacterized protein (TIGR02145 family)
MLYQWNRSTGWYDNAGTLTGVLKGGGTTTSWDSSYPSGTTWESANDPSPAGWRVPTYDEIQTLFDGEKVSYEWTTFNGVCGTLFTDKTTSKSIFLPAAGYRSSSEFLNAGTYGYYWSSTQYNSISAYGLRFSSGYAYCYNNNLRNWGVSVRCVPE